MRLSPGTLAGRKLIGATKSVPPASFELPVVGVAPSAAAKSQQCRDVDEESKTTAGYARTACKLANILTKAVGSIGLTM